LKELESEQDLISTIELPSSKKSVVLKSLTGKDTEAIIRRSKNNKEDSYIDMMASRIKSIDQENSFGAFKRILPDLIGKDSAALKSAINKLNFGVLQSYSESCDSCGLDNQFSIEVTEEFFRPEE
jgi:archaellum component FlaC